MPGTLYVVATPIGNLEDVTIRALRVLRDVSVIAAEDTRRTSRLLQQYSISTPTTSLHEHNERARSAQLLGRLAAGESVALVSDAGTPAISDPGARLVAAAHAEGFRVEPVPGPSAWVAAVSVAGFEADQVLFLGFPPARANARMAWLQSFDKDAHRLLVLYEAPHRIRATLADIFRILGDREIVLCRELTKMHESVVRRPISAILERDLPERGEFTVVIAPQLKGAGACQALPSDREIAAEFYQLTKVQALGRRAALKELAAKFRLSARTVYQAIERARNSVE
ncbi:MAG TPA: 16S rRNA (cytidine(1402)-2'-O)-methyltransferase [Vicinamibacterales bacterium]|nr:16S rRNA (cytidine(1402)-2'-O)-methyltransferase [Vicinamibacterales bacterium]